MDLRKAGAIALSIIAVAFRLCAIALAAITVVLCFSGLSARFNLVGLVIDLSRLVPALVAGYGVTTTPFGGVFRFDFAIMVLVLFLLDYACVRASRALRSGGF